MNAFISASLRPEVVRTAFRIAIIVGTVLALINHGPAIFSLTLKMQNIAQILLSYLVPYSVSTYSSVKIILAN